MKDIIPVERIENRIFIIKGQKVIFDKDLAELYGVGTRELNKAVTRNLFRFPADFMFQLNKEEFSSLMYQFGTSSWGGTRKLPRVFTEQGVAMLSSVLKSRRAVEINILIMRAFVKLRKVLASHKDLIYMFRKLEQKVGRHDAEIGLIIRAIEKMIDQNKRPKGKIGFLADK